MNFIKAKPVWLKELSKDINIQAKFSAEFQGCADARLHITGSFNYKVYLNGNFIHYGPARTAYGYARIDVVHLNTVPGENVISVEAAGYNCNSFCFVNQESFVQAEVTGNGTVLCATGYNFAGARVTAREQKCLRYSYQRTFSDVWTFSDNDTVSADVETLSPDLRYLERKSPFPEFKTVHATDICVSGTLEKINLPEYRKPRFIENSDPNVTLFAENVLVRNQYEDYIRLVQCPESISNTAFNGKIALKNGQYAIFDFRQNRTGFIRLTAATSENCRIIVSFSEKLCDNRLLISDTITNAVDFVFKTPGEHEAETFECSGFKYLAVCILSGEAAISDIAVRECCSPVNTEGLNSGDAVLDSVYAAAVETYRQNAVDIYMDCPTRERAGWLCDSYYTAQAEYALTGNTCIEDDFTENYILSDNHDIPEGMLHMCYPADHKNGSYVPQWAMWFALELEQYLKYRNGTAHHKYRRRLEALADFYSRYENEYGLLENLPGWNIVEWSRANEWLNDVNFPTNMLYVRFLEITGRLLERGDLEEKARKLKNTIIDMSFNGSFFADNAARENGKLVAAKNISEVCQYYAVRMLGINLHDSKYKDLKNAVFNVFCPERSPEVLPDIVPAAPFMGIYMRMEILYGYGRHNQLLSEIKRYFAKMAAETNTLWEHNDSGRGSMNHGFASFAAAMILKCLRK